jgi:hypothetical protein
VWGLGLGGVSGWNEGRIAFVRDVVSPTTVLAFLPLILISCAHGHQSAYIPQARGTVRGGRGGCQHEREP